MIFAFALPQLGIAATRDAPAPDREMLRMMELLRQMDMIKQMDMLREMDRLGGGNAPMEAPPVSTSKQPEKSK